MCFLQFDSPCLTLPPTPLSPELAFPPSHITHTPLSLHFSFLFFLRLLVLHCEPANETLMNWLKTGNTPVRDSRENNLD